MPRSSVAAIDIGTNSVRLLVLDSNGRELIRLMEITRLGQGVDEKKRLHPEAMDRTLHVLTAYGKHLERFGVSKVRATATSAARDAENREEFFNAVERALGHRPELLPGSEEATLSFLGATAELPPTLGPFMVFDIGGGSTEFAYGRTEAERFMSVDMGGVRITERFLHSDPPTDAEINSARAHIRTLLGEVQQYLQGAQVTTWLGLAGTVTTFAAHAAGLSHYDATKTHGFPLSREQIRSFSKKLLSVPTEQRAKLLVEPKRASVIIGGALVLAEIAEVFDLATVRTSEQDILDGLAQSCNS